MEGARYVPLPLFLLQFVHKDFKIVSRNAICLGLYLRVKEGETREEVLNFFYELPEISKESFEDCLRIGEEVYKLVQGRKEPTPHVKLSMLLEYRDRSKTIEQLDEFCCYVAIRSIIAKGYPCWKTNNELIFIRMLGYKDSLPEELTEHTRLFMGRYSTKGGKLSTYKMNNLIKIMEANWRLVKLSQKETRQQMRGFYLGYKDKYSLEEMFNYATRKKRKADKVQKDKLDAIKKFRNKNNDF